MRVQPRVLALTLEAWSANHKANERAARFLSLKMASVVEEPKAGTSKLSAEDKVEQAVALKEKGNDYFKKQEYRNAMKSYHKALLHVKGLIDQPSLPGRLPLDLSDEVKNNICLIQFSCYNNLAGKT